MSGSEFGDDLVFVPLGGAGEIGMNLNLYGYRGRWLAVDLGISFGDDDTPGIDILAPDTSFIAERRDKLDGLVLTHAHEDHLGAVPYVWRTLGCPIYATPFAHALLRRKLVEAGMEDDVPVREIPAGGKFEVGDFAVEYIRVTHSIPEAHVLAIRTPAGTIAHATDWKLDPAPLVGPVTDAATLQRLGEEGVLALICDSTNATVSGHSQSEGPLRESLTELIGRCERRVAVACFSSNVARLQTIAAAAAANDRQVCLVGRSLVRMAEIARETGYLTDDPPLLTQYDAGYLPPEKLVLAVTGSQGEPRSALSRIATGDHPNVVLERGDTVIFSSRQIPGNEISIGRVQNQLSRAGIDVITESDHFVHVSGHPARDELLKMYEWIQPRMLVPIHGEARHLHEHVELAREAGITRTVVAENGSVVRLGSDGPEVIDHVPSGRLAIDGTRLVPLDGAVMRARRRIGFVGAAVATVVVDGRGRLMSDPQLTVHGLLDGEDDDESWSDAIDAIADAVEGMSDKARRDDDEVSETVRIAVRRSLRDTVGKRPVTEVHVVRL